MGIIIIKKLALLFTTVISVTISIGKEEDKGGDLNLSDAFAQAEQELSEPISVEPEVEPIVVGRKKWNEKPATDPTVESNIQLPSLDASTIAIQELDPLETKQNQTAGVNMKITPPAIPPAVNLHRNFEGTLVLKPRSLGFEKHFPFQLENTRGRRLAFVDMENLKVTDPLDYKNKRVNILGKLEPIEEGKKDLVIRARQLRSID